MHHHTSMKKERERESERCTFDVLFSIVAALGWCRRLDDRDEHYSVDLRHSFMSICHSLLHSSWGHSLLCIIRQQQPKTSSSLHIVPSHENPDLANLTLSPDQAAHARACAK